MNEYRIIVNGKIQAVQSYGGAEMAVRGIMCWYGEGTYFTVLDSENNATVFQIGASGNPISGYRELVKISS